MICVTSSAQAIVNEAFGKVNMDGDVLHILGSPLKVTAQPPDAAATAVCPFSRLPPPASMRVRFALTFTSELAVAKWFVTVCFHPISNAYLSTANQVCASECAMK